MMSGMDSSLRNMSMDIIIGRLREIANQNPVSEAEVRRILIMRVPNGAQSEECEVCKAAR